MAFFTYARNPREMYNISNIKYRFDPIHIDRLMKIRWWEFNDTIIAKYVDLLCNDNIELFLNEFEKELINR